MVVVEGTARITLGDEVPGKLDLHLIEVQSGSYLSEDDITRYEDIYAAPDAANLLRRQPGRAYLAEAPP